MQPQFIHLRLHTEFSLVDGIVRIKPLVDRLTELNMPAVAVTEQSNLFSLVKFYRATVAAGIKTIVGADIHLYNPDEPTKPFLLTLLVNTQQGYITLTELISKAYQAGQHLGVPMVQESWLIENHQGLIALSGAMEGDIGQALLTGNLALARQQAQKWATLFKDSFYLELQRIGKTDEWRYLKAAVELAMQLDLPVVATNNVRFLYQKDFAAHEVRVCINQGRVIDDARRPKDYTDQQYLRSTEEMLELFADIPEALANTVEIAKRCNLELTLGKNYLPDFPVPEGMTLDEVFRQASKDGLNQRLQEYAPIGSGSFEENRKAYDARLQLELDVICQMGFPGYFMIVADFIHWAKKELIPVGPGRGSGAGSLVAYVLRITDLDPIEFDLLFERFLNPERVSMPDFDIDFCMERRDEVIDYVARHYGRDKVSQIITYGSMAAKAVIRDVGRVSGHPYGFVDRLAKLIPFEIGMTLEKALLASLELKDLYDTDEEVKALLDMAKSLEGISRNAGKHAGGVVISPTKLTDFTPLYCDESGDNLVTQFDKDDVEAVGLVKFDFLGLRTLTIIDWAIQTINAEKKKNGEALIDISQIPRNDPDTYKNIFQTAQTTAVFQLESRGMKELIGKLKPDCFDDIIALVALYRPGPLESGMVDDYIKVKHGAKAEYAHPILEPILQPTNGVILYQEQVMQIAREMAGYTLGGADMLRRCLSGSTEVIDVATGKKISLQKMANNPDYWRGRKVFSLNLTTQKIVKQSITEIYPNGVHKIWEITTKTNRKIRATANHLFYTIQGWQQLDQFRVGNYIGLAKKLPIENKSPVLDAQIKLIAYLIGDGHLSTKNPASSYFCNTESALIDDFNLCCVDLFGKKASLDYQPHEGWKTVCYARVGFISKFNQWIDQHVKRAHSRDKEIPLWGHQLSSKQLCLFLGILWSTDGSFDTGIGHTDYTSTSPKLIEQIQHLLLRLGIVALFNIKKIQYKGKPHLSYRAQITGREDMLKFCALIMPFLSDAKKQKSELAYQTIKDKQKNQSKHLLPKEITYLIKESKYASGMSWSEIDRAIGAKRGTLSSGLNFKQPNRRLARHRVKNFGIVFNDEGLINIAESDVFWDEIVSIKYVGEEDVFDLSIPETHNFIANEFIAHNCMGKKKPEEMAKQREIFTVGSIKNNIEESIATYVFDLMEKFAGYGFNKSHSAAYALVAYQTAWLKAHYPAAFMAAVLSADMDNTDKVVMLIEECRQMKLDLSPPNVNVSNYRFTTDDPQKIVYGIGAIKGVGQSAIEDLIDERKQNGLFSGLYDLCKRVELRKVNRRVLEALIRAGAFDLFDDNRAGHFAELPIALRIADQHGKMAVTGQNDMFGLMVQTASNNEGDESYSTQVEPWAERDRLEGEKQTLGLYLTGHPINQYQQELKYFTHGNINKLLGDVERSRGKVEARVAGLVLEIRTRQTKKGTTMGFAVLDDRTGRLEVAAFSKTYEQYRDVFVKDALLVAEGGLAMDDFSGMLRLTAEKMYSIEQARAMFSRCLAFEWHCRDANTETSEFISILREIIAPFKGGDCPLVIHYFSKNAATKLQLGEHWRVQATDELILRLQRCSYIKAVEIKYK